MTSSFDDRQKAFENKFQMDEEFRFKVNARAVRLLGVWAAGKMGVTGAEADKYAEDVLDADFDEPGVGDVLRKVQKDLATQGIEFTEHHLQNEFNVCLEQAKKDLMA